MNKNLKIVKKELTNISREMLLISSLSEILSDDLSSHGDIKDLNKASLPIILVEMIKKQKNKISEIKTLLFGID